MTRVTRIELFAGGKREEHALNHEAWIELRRCRVCSRELIQIRVDVQAVTSANHQRMRAADIAVAWSHTSIERRFVGLLVRGLRKSLVNTRRRDLGI